MVRDNERKQLLNDYLNDPQSVVWLLLTCAGGLLVVMMLAWIGYDIYTYDGETPGPASTANLERPAQ